MIGYSPKFPLQIDNQLGAYSITTTLQQVVKQNFINLMLTAPGERIMDIDFGVGLRNYLFEQNTPFLQEQIAEGIRDQTSIYMPFITLNNINFNEGELLGGYEGQILDISIEYFISSLNVLDSISVSTTTEQ
jgi:phage baseplate assembly protein W